MTGTRTVIVVGAGMGGLAAAITLARAGFHVRVFEAREESGGLASGLERDGLTFDAGPYILLDRPGLEWAFRALDLGLDDLIELRPISHVYQVRSSETAVHIHADLTETAAGFDRCWPGSGRRYVEFVGEMWRTYNALRPLQYVSRPGVGDLVRHGAWRNAPFLLRSLGSVLGRAGLPPPVVHALGIWTDIAGQRLQEAPSPLALVPAVIHHVGAFFPVRGINSIPQALTKAAVERGVEFHYGEEVRKIQSRNGRVTGVETSGMGFVPADTVISNHHGIGTYLTLLDELPRAAAGRLAKLPLQSPGVCAYLEVKGIVRPPYLRFYRPGNGRLCQLLVLPAAVVPDLCRNGVSPARLIGPMRHDEASRAGAEGQRQYLDQLLEQPWWRQELADDGRDVRDIRDIRDIRLMAARTPSDWGAQYHLFRDSMNPVMTASFMRAGRLAHRSPFVRGLYLTGSSTHPGQWVSFCAISGVLAGELAANDLRRERARPA